MTYMSNKEESKAIRELFKTDASLKSYKLRQNGHSTGTAYGWIAVTVTYPDDMYPEEPQNEYRNEKAWQESRRIYFLIKNAVGRGDRFDDIMTDYFCENISFTFQKESEYAERNQWKVKRKETLLKNKTCPNCGTISNEFRRDGYRYIRCCKKCETQWSHGSA
jgi:hypothetical protein